MDKVHYSGFDSPFGLVFVARTAKGICLVNFSNVSERKFLSVLKKRYHKNILRDHKVFADVKKSLAYYFKGEQNCDRAVPLFEKVLETIPEDVNSLEGLELCRAAAIGAES